MPVGLRGFQPGNMLGKKFAYQGGKCDVICAECGAGFQLYLSDIKRGRRFCSDTCGMAWFSRMWRGPAHHHYNPNKDTKEKIKRSLEYGRWRALVLERDGYQCRKCGSGEDLHAHHCIPLSQDLTKALDVGNGLTLCIACHQTTHPELRMIMQSRRN